MVAYSFKARFAEPILAGTKRQTIRAIGKRRHARPGDALQLYTGMRTAHCRKIADKTCIAAEAITLDWRSAGAAIIDGKIILNFDDLARNDGFKDGDEMKDFWRENHPGVEMFDGILIRW